MRVPRQLIRLLYWVYSIGWRLVRPLTIGVRVMVIEGDELLLVKPVYLTYWTLPGGLVKRGETLEQAAWREVQEETGVRLGLLALLGVYNNFHEGKRDYVVLFQADRVSQEDTSSWEVERAEFFPLTGLPADLSPGIRRRLEERVRGDFPAHGHW